MKKKEIINGKLQCSKCKNLFPATLEFFYNNKKHSNGFTSRCKKCCYEAGKKYRANNKEKIKEYGKKYYIDNKKRLNINQINWHMLNRYGISKENLDVIFIFQKKRCLGCGKKLEKYYVDHDHKTGEFRGLVCNNCNSIMGYAKDNTLILIRLVKYLRGEL